MKKRRIIITSVLSVVILLFTTVMIYYFGAGYKDFSSISKKEFKIPGLDTTFVPQGMTYLETTNDFLVAGYMSSGEASRVYLIDGESGDTEKYITLKNDGDVYVGHAGGITDYGDNIYVVGDKEVLRFSLTNLYSAENGDEVAIIDSFETGNGCDFVLTYGANLIVGEFYKKDKYETPELHHIQTSNGLNYAMAYVYNLKADNEYGLESLEVQSAISMPNQVQGMTFTKEDKIILSTSYSIPNSKLLVYDNVLRSEAEKSISINNREVPLYVLESSNLEKTLVAPSMSEELELVDDRVYVLFESNCKKYRLFNRTRLSNVYSLDI